MPSSPLGFKTFVTHFSEQSRIYIKAKKAPEQTIDLKGIITFRENTINAKLLGI